MKLTILLTVKLRKVNGHLRAQRNMYGTTAAPDHPLWMLLPLCSRYPQAVERAAREPARISQHGVRPHCINVATRQICHNESNVDVRGTGAGRFGANSTTGARARVGWRTHPD